MIFTAISPADSKRRLVSLIAVVVPPAALVLALGLLWGRAVDWVSLGLLIGMTLITTMGVTVGFHRLCTHRSFRTPAFVRYLFAAAGSMAVQGPVITWCAEHRRHHLHADTEGDPHSPHMGEHGSWGDGFWAMVRGAYHAHVGWLFGPRSRGLGRYSKDLKRDPVLVAADRQFLWWVLAGLFIPAALGGLITLSWWGALLGFLWGGLVRVLVVHHVTWSVNSICHLWGSRPYDSGDESRNNAIVGLITFGEGWHNNHHAFPSSARFGLRWWQLDASYWLICALGWVGLAKDIRTPSDLRLKDRRIGPTTRRRSRKGRRLRVVLRESEPAAAASVESTR
ncbi:MAG: acyl-CoA desaturase [Phycisphaerae bacterium]|nr:acyl-CoA desaturase [Phycisphaerae bacterium]